MAETSRSQVTITLGRSRQVVKRAGAVLDNEPTKRSVRDRLGGGVELHNKRLRGDNGRWNFKASDDLHLSKDDLRFKIMKRAENKSQQKMVDLRDKLSRSSTTNNGRQRPSSNSNSNSNSNRQRMVVVDDRVRKLRPPVGSSSQLHYPTSMGNSWTLDRIRRKSPEDRVLSTPHRQRYEDSRSVAYGSSSRPVGAFLTKQPLSVGPLQQTRTLPPAANLQRSRYPVEHESVEGFLRSLGLEKYLISFKVEEVDMAALSQMRDQDLKELGIPMGPRKKMILALIARTRR